MKWYGLLTRNISLQIFQRLSFTNFTWSILEYFVPYSILHIPYSISHIPYYITNFEGSKIDIATSRFSICQIVNIPPHVLNNTSSCIDLIFISQPNLVMHFDVDPFLYPNCNHQIVFSKFNLKIPYLPHMNA